MTNTELSKMLQDFIATQDDTSKDEWYGTDLMFARSVINHFVIYMQQQGVRITLPNKELKCPATTTRLLQTSLEES